MFKSARRWLEHVYTKNMYKPYYRCRTHGFPKIYIHGMFYPHQEMDLPTRLLIAHLLLALAADNDEEIAHWYPGSTWGRLAKMQLKRAELLGEIGDVPNSRRIG